MIRALIIDTATPEYACLRPLLDGANPGGWVDGASGILELLASRQPGELVLLQPGPRAGMHHLLYASVRGDLQQVAVSEVRYFMAEHKYVWVRTAQSRVLIRASLAALAEEFAGHFVRIHRNALIATHYLTGLSRSRDGRCSACLTGIDETLPVSRRRVAVLRRLVRSYGMGSQPA